MRQNIFIAASTGLSILVFFGGAVYIVIQGSTERDNICEEVQELRDDIVAVLNLSIERSRAQGEEADSKAVERIRKIIDRPSC